MACPSGHSKIAYAEHLVGKGRGYLPGKQPVVITELSTGIAKEQYIDLDKYEQWFYKLCERSEETQSNINPGAFYNYLKLILFIEKNPKFFK